MSKKMTIMSALLFLLILTLGYNNCAKFTSISDNNLSSNTQYVRSKTSDTGHTVSAILFPTYGGEVNNHWKTSTGWQPAGGWDSYDSRNKEWAKREIKDAMSANIDVLFISVEYYISDNLNGMKAGDYKDMLEKSMDAFFTGAKELVDEGYDIPALAPWHNHEPFYTGADGKGPYTIVHGGPLDLGTNEGRSTYYNSYFKPYWDRYFKIMGDQAKKYIALRDGKVIISLDTLMPGGLQNESSDFYNFIKTQFQNDYGLSCVIMGSMSDIGLNGLDEVHYAFGPLSDYYLGGHDTHGKMVIEILPGFWNPSPPDYAPRHKDGVNYYKQLWEKSLAQRNNVQYLGITSWNYFGEGSNICDTDPKVNPNMTNKHDDENWGSDSSRYYIDLTAYYASQWNDVAEYDAEIISHELPTSMEAGKTYHGKIVVRNFGDAKWNKTAGFSLVGTTGAVEIDEEKYEVSKYGGIFRGRPITFEFDFTAPTTAGAQTLKWQMQAQGKSFGDSVSIDVTIGSTPATTTVAVTQPPRDSQPAFTALLGGASGAVATPFYPGLGTGLNGLGVGTNNGIGRITSLGVYGSLNSPLLNYMILLQQQTGIDLGIPPYYTVDLNPGNNMTQDETCNYTLASCQMVCAQNPTVQTFCTQACMQGMQTCQVNWSNPSQPTIVGSNSNLNLGGATELPSWYGGGLSTTTPNDGRKYITTDGNYNYPEGTYIDASGEIHFPSSGSGN